MSLGINNNVLTEQGFFRLDELMDSKCKLWDGVSFKTFEFNVVYNNEELFQVELSNGNIMVCDKEYIPKMLTNNEILPTLNPDFSLYSPYTCGLYASGLPDEDEYTITTTNLDVVNCTNFENYIFENNQYKITLREKFPDRYFVPINYSLHTKIYWLYGFLAGGYKLEDECIVLNGNDTLLRNISLMLQTCGIQSNFYNNKLYILQKDLIRFGMFFDGDVLNIERDMSVGIVNIQKIDCEYTVNL